MPSYVGVDGCKAGWFAVTLTDDGRASYDVFDTAEALLTQYSDVGQICIDIPIGLTNDGVKRRVCDEQARNMLTHVRGPSVFTTPARPSLLGSDRKHASQINFDLTGRKIPKQTWEIMSKIREVDELMASRQVARETLVEVHPELLFWSLNDHQPMRYSKRSIDVGIPERIEVLRRWFPATDEIYEDVLHSYLRKKVARDDILDALVAAVAGYVSQGKMINIPDPPEMDPTGLPMRMAIPRL